MGLQDAIEAIPRKTMVLFFLIDTSGSMDGSKIGAVNTAIAEVIPELRSISQANADALIKVAALEFADDAKWITPEPVDVDNFYWNNINADGSTNLQAAFMELNSKLSTKEFMREATGSFAPALFLLSDGMPDNGFEAGLAELQKNNWYRQAVKVAIAIGNDADKNMLAQFTGIDETVLEAQNTAMLKKLIKFVSVRASQVASQSVQAGAFLQPGQQNLPDPEDGDAVKVGNPFISFLIQAAKAGSGSNPAAQTAAANSSTTPAAIPITQKQAGLARQFAGIKKSISGKKEEW